MTTPDDTGQRPSATPTRADCIGGGYAYVGHGEDCVMVAFSPDVGWWRNSAWFTPQEGRRLAERLLEQVGHAERDARAHEGAHR